MRIAALVVAVIACLGCKDKKPAQKQAEPSTPPRQTQKPPPRPALETPDVTGPGLVQVTKIGPKITYAKDSIQVDGQTVITIGKDGLVDAQRMATLTRVLEDKARSDDPIGIALDATIPYVHVASLLGKLKLAGFRNLALLAGPTTMIPIELLDTEEANAGNVRPVVTVQHGRVVLWSVTGAEGTRRKPKLDIPLDGARNLQPLTRALGEIVQRRWPDGKRQNVDRTIMIQVDRREPAEVLLRVLAAVRSDGALELFPNVFLTGGL